LAAPPLGGLLAPPLAAGARLVAYLETWERHISAVEDPGIREEALGGTDTTARTELVGQVKLATLTGLSSNNATAAAQARAAFAQVEVSGGQVTIAVPEASPTTDPCALPDVAGYSGADNRLYRVEVHTGGALAALRLKWSRDNGSELFAARLNASRNLVFDAGTPLAAGDIVEVLDNVVDLGDDALAVVGAGGFTPARRAVGQVAQLAAVPSPAASDEVIFKLVDVNNTGTNVPLDTKFDEGVKLRRWHGILAAGGSVGPHVLEDGITVTLSSGAYRAGQYWQYEARVRGENANGPWRPAPHGPERRFAPLALLRFDSATEPLRLLAWLDERFSNLCDLDADDVAFAGARVGSTSDTVQEAIEELFERPPEIVDASCGELIIRPENNPQTVFNTIPAGGDRRICIHPGTWNLTSTIVVQGKGDLVISGAGDATRFNGPALDTVLRFVNCGTVRIQDISIDGGHAGAAGGALAAHNCAGLDLQRVNVAVPDHPARRVNAVEARMGTGVNAVAPEVRIRDCHLSIGHAQTGVLVINPATVDIEASSFTSPPHPLTVEPSRPEVLGALTRQLIDGDWFIGETEEANDELLVGSPNVVVETDPLGGLRRFIVHLEQFGNQFITFRTQLNFNADQWRQVFVGNGFPFPGDAGVNGVDKLIRRLRRRLVNSMFNLPNGATLPAGIRNVLLTMGNAVTAQTTSTAGGQAIVVAGLGTQIDPAFPEPRVLTGDNPRPDIRITGNRIAGFMQGIHVGTSVLYFRGLSYRVTIADNMVHLRVPGTAPEPHGIFVGSAYHLRVEGNTVEVRTPGPSGWTSIPPTDAIRVYGCFGPLIRVRSNDAVGTRNGVVAHATNHVHAGLFGWLWLVEQNTHVSSGPPVPQTRNW
jgi:hypothetical protein